MDANNLLPSEGTPGFIHGLSLAALTARELADAWLQRGWPRPRPAALKLAQDLVAAGFPSIQSLATASQESLKRLPVAHDDLEWVVHDARRCVASHADGCSQGDIDHLDHPMPTSGAGSPGETRAVSGLTITQKSLSGASLATCAGSRDDGRSSVASVESIAMGNLLDGDPSSTAQFPWADPDPFASRVSSPHTSVCDWLHHEAKLSIEQARAVAAALHSRLASPARHVTMEVLRPFLCEQLLRSICPGIDSAAVSSILAKCEEERQLDDSPTLLDSPASGAGAAPPSLSSQAPAAPPAHDHMCHSAAAGGRGGFTHATSSAGAFVPVSGTGSRAAAAAPIATLPTQGGSAGFGARAQVYAGLGTGPAGADGHLVFHVHGQRVRGGVIRGDTSTLLAEARDRVTRAIKPPISGSPTGASDVRFRFVHALSLEPIPAEAEWSTTVLQAGGSVVVQVYDTVRHKQFFPPVCVCCAVLRGAVAGAYVSPTAKGGKPWGRPIPKKVQWVPNETGALVQAGRHSNDRARCCDSHARNVTKPSPASLTSVSHSACMWHVVGIATGVTLKIYDPQTTAVTVGFHVRTAGCPCRRSAGAGCQAQALQRSVDRLKPLGIFERTCPVPPIVSPRAMPSESARSPPALLLPPPGPDVQLQVPPAPRAPPALEVVTKPGEVRVVHHPNGVHIVRRDRLQCLPDHPIRDGAVAAPHDQWLLTVQGWSGRHTRLPILVLPNPGPDPTNVLVGAQLESLLPGLASSPGRRQKAVLQHVAPGDFIMPCSHFRAIFTVVHVRMDELPMDDQRQARREIMARFPVVLQDHCRFKRHRDMDDDDDRDDDRGGHRRRPSSSGSGGSGASASDSTSSGSNGSSGAGGGSSAGGGSGDGGGNGAGCNSGAGGSSCSGSCQVPMTTDDAAFYAANAPPRMAADEDAEHSFIVWLEFAHHLQTIVPDDSCPPLAEYTTGASHGNYGAVHVAAFIGPAALALALDVCRLDPQQLCADGTAFDVATKFGPQACVRMLEGIIDERTSESSATASAAASLRSPTPPARAAVDRVPLSLSIQGGDDLHGRPPVWDLLPVMQQATAKVEVAGPLPALVEADEQASNMPNPCANYVDDAAYHQLGIDVQRCAQGHWAGTPPPGAAKHKHRPRGATVHRIKSGADIVPSPGFDPHRRRSTGSLAEGDGEFKGYCSPAPRLAKPTAGVVHGTVAPDLRQRAPIGTSPGAVASPSAEQAEAQHIQLVQLIETLLASAKADASFAGHVASKLCESNMLGFAPAPRRPCAFQRPASVATGAGKAGSQYCHGCTSTVPVSGTHELLPGASTPLCHHCCSLVRCLQDSGFNPSVDQYDDRIAHILTLIKLDASPTTTREDLRRPPHLEWTVAARHATVSLVRVDRRTGLPTGPRIELPEYRNETKRITFVPPGRYMVEMSAIPRAGDWVDLSLGVGLNVCDSSTNQYKLVKLPLQNRPGSGRRGHRVDCGGGERGTRPLSSTKQCFVDGYQVCARGEAVSIMPQFGPVDLEAGSTCRLAALACLSHEIIKDHDDDFSDLDQQHWLAFKIFCYRDSAPYAELGSDAERAPLCGSPCECSRSVPSRFNEDAESDYSPVVQDFKVQPGLNSFDSPREAHTGRTTPPPSQRQGQLRPIAIDNGTKRDTRGHSVASALSTLGSLLTRSATGGQDPPVTSGHLTGESGGSSCHGPGTRLSTVCV